MPGQLFGELCLVLHHGHNLCCLEQNDIVIYHTGDIPHQGYTPENTAKGA